tara:strand:- start:11 stop:679 length:669 start_codon:yes stop_codon:yes gene_type:complete
MTESRQPLHYIVHSQTAPRQDGPLLVLLHGYGSNEQDLVGLAPYLDSRFLCVSMRAPYALDFGGYAWFHIDFTPQGILLDYEQARASSDHLLETIESLRAEYAAAAVYLLGFSQGASMAFNMALHHPQRYAGVAALSGVCSEEMLPQEEAEGLGALPVLMTHGRWDQLIPVAQARASSELLQGLPLQLTYKEYDMGHEINQECLGDVRYWLQERLGVGGGGG